MKRIFHFLPVILIIASLVVLDVFLLLKYKSAQEEVSIYKRKLAQVSDLGFSMFRSGVFESLDGKEIILGEGGKKLSILIFFTPNDCPSCIFSLIRWSKVNKIFSGKVKVIGVCSEQNDDYYRGLIARYKFNFPIVRDTQCSGFKYLNPELQTPIIVYLNGNNEVIDYDNTSSLPDDDVGLEHKIRNLLEVVDSK